MCDDKREPERRESNKKLLSFKYPCSYFKRMLNLLFMTVTTTLVAMFCVCFKRQDTQGRDK